MVKENKRLCVNDTIQISYSKEARRINMTKADSKHRNQAPGLKLLACKNGRLLNSTPVPRPFSIFISTLKLSN